MKTGTHRSRWPREVETEIGVMLPQAKPHLRPPKGMKGTKGPAPRDCRGAVALPTP